MAPTAREQRICFRGEYPTRFRKGVYVHHHSFTLKKKSKIKNKQRRNSIGSVRKWGKREEKNRQEKGR